MKKVLIVLLTVVMSLSLFGCSNSAEKSAAKQSAISPKLSQNLISNKLQSIIREIYQITKLVIN